MKKLLLITLIIISVGCTKDKISEGATNEYLIYTRVSFGENIYAMHVNFIHDGDRSFNRYENNDQTDSYFEDSKSFLAENQVGIEIDSKTTVPTKSIDIQIRNVGSGELLVSETIEKNIGYNIPGHHKVRLIYDLNTESIDVKFLN